MAHSSGATKLDKKMKIFVKIIYPLPLVWILRPDGGDIDKYVFRGEITAENIIKFYTEYKEGNLRKVVQPLFGTVHSGISTIAPTNKNGVVLLKDKSFIDYINYHDHVLVWIGGKTGEQNAMLFPAYAAAAKQLRKEGSAIKVAFVLLIECFGKCDWMPLKYEINNDKYPQLRFFNQGE